MKTNSWTYYYPEPDSQIKDKVKVALEMIWNDLDLGKLRTVPVGWKKLSDVVDNVIVKTTNFNTLKTKVNSLEQKIPDATILIHIN